MNCHTRSKIAQDVFPPSGRTESGERGPKAHCSALQPEFPTLLTTKTTNPPTIP